MRSLPIRLLAAHADFAEALNHGAFAEVFQLEKLAHLDFTLAVIDGGIWKAPGPFDRLFPRLRLNERVAGDQFLGLGERPVDECALVTGILDAPTLALG